MRTSKRGVDFLLAQEGCVLKPYRDQVGKWTIGVGHLILDGEDLMHPITKQECSDLLQRDLARFEREIGKLIKVALNQNQFDALVSLCFNCGLGPLIGGVGKSLNVGQYERAANRFLEWRNAGGKPILLARREAERALFLEPMPTEPMPLATLFDLQELVDVTPHRRDA